MTNINVSPELLFELVASKLRMWSEAHLQNTCKALGKSSASIGSVGWEVIGGH